MPFGTVWEERDCAKIVEACNWRSCVAEQTPKQASAKQSGGKPPHSKMVQTRSIGWVDFRSRRESAARVRRFCGRRRNWTLVQVTGRIFSQFVPLTAHGAAA